MTFVSTATTIASGGTNPGSLYHVYLKDLQAGTLRQLDLNTSGGQPVSGNARTPYISADGSRIVFASDAPDLVTNDTNGVQDIFGTLNPLLP